MAAEHVGVAGCDGVWQGDRVWQVGMQSAVDLRMLMLCHIWSHVALCLPSLLGVKTGRKYCTSGNCVLCVYVVCTHAHLHCSFFLFPFPFVSCTCTQC